MAKKVIVECDPDELLMKTLGLGRREIAHQSGKGEVCRYLSTNNVKIALVDEDPGSGQPKYLSKFSLEEEKFKVKKLVNNDTGKIILVLRPRLEEWILYQCGQSDISIEKFFLPADAKRLKDVINLRLDKFEKLLAELIAKENGGLLYLQSVIRHAYPI